jgi:acylphosphatase
VSSVQGTPDPETTMNPTRRVHLWIVGRVQGVFFRATTCDEARSLGLSGWVRNLPDGSVEAVAEGEAEAVERFVEFCRHGPPSARVDHLERVEEEPRLESGRFEVR